MEKIKMKQNGFILPNLNMYLAIGVVVAILAGATYLKIKFNNLQDEKAALTQKVSVLEAENAQLFETNKKNALVIEQMQLDKKNADKIVSDFRIQKARDNAELSALRNAVIQVDPAQNGKVSAVLKQTISALQDARKTVKTEEKTK